MDGVGAGSVGSVDEQVGAQIGVGRRVAGQVHSGVGLGDVRRGGVRVGVDGDGRDAEVAAGAKDPAGDLAPVGHQHRRDHRRNTPYWVVPLTGALWMADRHIPTTVRVSRGSITPSS